MARFARRLVPGVVLAVLELDRTGRHLFGLGAIEAGDIDGVERAAHRLVAAAPERLDAAMPAEEMVNVPAAELVVGKFGLALQDAEVVLSRDRLPEPALGADRTVAAAGALGRIEPAFETHSAAMASATMELFHFGSPHG